MRRELFEYYEMGDEMGILIQNGVVIVILVFFIHTMYVYVYGRTAAKYIRNQLNIIVSGSISALVFLTIYYSLENRFKLDANYLGGMGLVVFMLFSGICTKKLYNLFFLSHDSVYQATEPEYLFQIIVSYISASVILYSEGMLENPVVIAALVVGRLIWLDTSSIQAIVESIRVRHDRIKETSMIYLAGVAIVSTVYSIYNFNKIWITLVYGLIVVYVYGRIKKKGNANALTK